MKWCWLLLSISCEVIGTTFLKLSSNGGKNAGWYFGGVVLFYVICFALLGLSMKHFSLGTLYATRSGEGEGLLAVIGILFFNDEVNLLKIISFGLVIAGVVGLNMSGVSH
ncbi:MAG: multidrug efflux SMR transporter [Planctomycetales bacterium]